MNSAPRVAVIGAGFAGLAAAVALADGGIPVEVFEASRTLGGRARAIETDGDRLDNGQHILLGAYRETLALMARINAPLTQLQRHPLRLEYPGRLRLQAPKLPAPLHLAAALLGANGLNWREKWAAVRFMNRLKAQRYRLPQDSPLSTLLKDWRQPEVLCRYLWEPLCIAALNTPAEEASAQVFVNVLRDSLGGPRAASDLLLPTTDFTTLLPAPAARFITQRGGHIRLGHRVRQLHAPMPPHQGWRVETQKDEHGPYTHVVLATAPYHAQALIADLPALDTLKTSLQAFRYEPIATVYLQYPPTIALPFPMVGHAGGTLQWLFDRGALGGPKGLLAAVVSAHGPHDALPAAALAARIHGEIAQVMPDLPEPLWHRCIVERRATFACTPGLLRPATKTSLPGLWLAGDYTASDYPATLESAVRSGLDAARQILDPKAGI